VQIQTASGSTIIQFDASLSETYSTPLDITQFPIETGETISDHIIVKPFSMTFQGIISDTPIGGLAGLLTEGAATAVGGLLGPLGVVAGGAGVAAYNALTASPSPSVMAFVKLRSLAIFAPQPFTVVTKFGTYKNMLISNLSVPRDKGTGDCLIFDLIVTQVTIVTAASVDASNLSSAALSGSKADAGEQQAESSIISAAQRGVISGTSFAGG